MGELVALEPAESRALLRAGVLGRVGLVVDEEPRVLPMNYAVLGDAILLRTSRDGRVAAAAAAGERLAFEVDHVDHERWRGWSVLVVGAARIEPLTGPDRPVPLGGAVRPWAAGDRETYVRIACEKVTGWRLGSGWSPLAELPVRRTTGASRPR